MFDEALFQQRLDDFKPEPLIIPVDPTKEIEILMVAEDNINIDLAKVNYLNLLNNDEIKKICEDTIREYGVGTCGPPAFYGTTDVHFELHERLAKFLPFCRKRDVVFVDERANLAIEQGLDIALSKVVKFTHNDPEDFKAKVQEVIAKEKKKTRKFLVVEGISWRTGKLCPLPEFIAVAEEFKIRVFLEESHSLGVFGATGRGLTEYYNIDPKRIDMIFGTFEGAIGSIGGFSAGSYIAIEHHRMFGSAYMYSASLPTYLVKAVLKSIELLGDAPRKFSGLAKTFYHFLEKECRFKVESHPEAPFKLIRIKPKTDEMKVYQYCKERGVHFIQSDEGLVINLNVSLLDEKEKLERVYEVLKGASELIA
ncbi:serine palmitoyltransferase 1-like isoform X2 [Tenebrio molitor]|uniref:serine palmitoyltransferase 1-like isoform X2 n=1 Tax=Tenebrio molitor TaxID=7067 RepID=UPI003624A952